VIDVFALQQAAGGQMAFGNSQGFLDGSMALVIETDKHFTVGQFVNVQVKGGDIQDVVPETAEQEADRRRWDERQAAMEEHARQELETAKQTGHLLLDDGETDAWAGVTPDGVKCHHRHRSADAATPCAGKRS
jgi:hypothetical protein